MFMQLTQRNLKAAEFNEVIFIYGCVLLVGREFYLSCNYELLTVK